MGHYRIRFAGFVTMITALLACRVGYDPVPLPPQAYDPGERYAPGTKLAAAEPIPAYQVASRLTQFGITWIFDRNYTYGQFANGDYWVVGPLTIVHISPNSSDINGRISNGSQINPSAYNGDTQGYDSSMYARFATPERYDATLNVARPGQQDLSAENLLQVPIGSSLVSTISNPDPSAQPTLETAAILTVLEHPAPIGSFRPAYSGDSKTIIFNRRQLDFSLLSSLAPVATTPSLTSVEAIFERPWLDEVPGWIADYEHPRLNMPNYGRDISSATGVGALMLQLNFSETEKETLLVRYVQLGIDLYGIAQNGGATNWEANGGGESGRKWPILFAGLVLHNQAMSNIGSGDGGGNILFGEDRQTFYVSQPDVDLSHHNSYDDVVSDYLPSDIGMAEWGERHASAPVLDNKEWISGVRGCCTAVSWSGYLLVARMMNAMSLWDHPALFDYQDRYMAVIPPTNQHWLRDFDPFTAEMWDTYRADYGPIYSWP